jgi:hypothetical protein
MGLKSMADSSISQYVSRRFSQIKKAKFTLICVDLRNLRETKNLKLNDPGFKMGAKLRKIRGKIVLKRRNAAIICERATYSFEMIIR